MCGWPDTYEHLRAIEQNDSQPDSVTEKNIELKMAEQRSESARKASYIGHEEHYKMHDEVVAHYEEHKDEYSSVQDAARKIAGKIVPVLERTVAKWLYTHIKETK